jgi:4-amino-4-deoxy-L-arabinose transferase-like glycosyltransferase
MAPRMPFEPARAGFSGALDRHPFAVALGLFVVTLLVCGFRLDLPDVCGDDEAYDAGVIWEMAENGHWLLPFFNGEMVPEKPPLFFWIASGMARLRARVDETTIRLPSVVMAAITVVTVFLAGRHLVGTPVAFLASLITLSAPMTIARAHVGRVDMTLVACTTGAFFAATFGLAPNAPRWQRNAFWVLAALAVLAKAGAGLGIVACGVLGVAIADRRRLWHLVTPEGVVAFGLLAFSWYLFATWALGHRFVEVNLLHQNLNHFVGNTSGDWLTQRLRSVKVDPTLSLMGGLTPWSFFAALAFHQWRTALRGGSRPGLAWAAGGLLFFTAADARHSYYAAPLVPPFALFVAKVLYSERSSAPPRWTRAVLLSLGVAVIVICGAVPFLPAWAAAGWVGVSNSDRQNVVPLWLWWSRQPAAAIVLGILTVAILVFLGLTWRGGVGWILSALVASLVVQGALHEALGAATNSRFSLKAFAAEVARVEGPVYFYGPVIRQIVYHARRHIHPIEAWPEGPLFLIATEEQLAEFRGTYPVRQLAAGEGRVGESDNQRVLLLSIDGR